MCSPAIQPRSPAPEKSFGRSCCFSGGRRPRLHQAPAQGSSFLPCKWLKKFTQGGGKVTLVAQDESGRAFFGVSSAPPDKDEAAQEGEVGRGVTGPGAGLVLKPGGVAGMVVFVFDAPPAADGDQGVTWGERLAEDKDPPAGAGEAGGFVGAVAFDFEELRGVDEAELFWGDVEGAVVSLVEAAVTRFERRGEQKGGGHWVSRVSARWAAWS